MQLDKLRTGDNPSNLGMLSKGGVWNHDTRGWGGETMLSEEGMGNHSIRGWGGGPYYLKVIWRTILFEKFSTTDHNPSN